jgi:hypothetical protein
VPSNATTALGIPQQFTATGTYTDGSTQNITSSVTWASANTSVATISNAAGSKGLATTVSTGFTNISATHPASGVFASTIFTVTSAALVSISLTPAHSSKALGLTQQFTATGTYTDATTQDISSSVTWSSSSTATATISNAAGTNGLATTVATGSTTITATHSGSGVSANTSFTVSAAELVSLAITPANSSKALGLTQQFTATGTYTNGTTQDLTTTVTWSSSSTATATISNAAGTKGLATTIATGSTTITATHSGSGVSANTSFTVSAAELVSLAITPANPTLILGSTQQFTATGTYTDGSNENVTSSVTWSSSITGVATISNAGGSQGMASAVGAGNTTISAMHGSAGVSASTGFTVQGPVSVRLLVVAGGGSGYYGAGGGGGVVYNSDLSVNRGSVYSVTVGAGGNRLNRGPLGWGGEHGRNSVFQGAGIGTITAIGGGGGAAGAYVNGSNSNSGFIGGSGGSGGGGGANLIATGSAMPGGSGTAGQGYAGGTTNAVGCSPAGAGGGGGGNASGQVGGVGYLATIIDAATASAQGVGEVSGNSVYFAGGGGGGSHCTSVGAGGLGGSGDGRQGPSGYSAAVQDAAANTGGGGGGGQYSNGGSGVVIIRVAGSQIASTTGSVVTTTINGDSVWIFKGDGTINFQ